MIVEPRPEHLVWLDGKFVRWADATMHLSAHHYGFGVFEGVRSYVGERGAAIFRLADHTRRLFRSARMLKLRIPDAFDADCLNRAQLELLRRNQLGDAYLRPFVFLDGFLGLRPSSRDLSVRVAVLAVAWQSSDTGQGSRAARGLTLKTSSFLRHPPNTLLSKAKANGNYLGGMLALEEAQSSGADDAVLLDQNGFVTETTGANLFLVKEGALFTPPVSSVLDGVTRDTVFTLAKAAGLAVSECPLTRDELYVADEAFITGTAAEVSAIAEVDGRPIGTAAVGPITRRLQTMYAAHVRGRGEGHPEWLTIV